MDIVNAILAVLNFVLGAVWAVVWFLLRDLLSTVLWLAVAIWLIVSVRYRSFAAGSLAMLRYGRLGARLLWRWARGGAAAAVSSAVVRDKAEVRVAARRVPIGYMSVSTQFNILIVAGLGVLIYG